MKLSISQIMIKRVLGARSYVLGGKNTLHKNNYPEMKNITMKL